MVFIFRKTIFLLLYMLDSDGKIKNPWRRSHISRKELLHRARNHYDVIGFALDAHIALVFSANVLFSVCIVSKHRKPSFVSRRLDQNFLQLNACGCVTVLSCFECCLRNENETKLFFRRVRRLVDQVCLSLYSFYIFCHHNSHLLFHLLQKYLLWCAQLAQEPYSDSSHPSLCVQGQPSVSSLSAGTCSSVVSTCPARPPEPVGSP